MTSEEIKKVLDLHRKWLNNEQGGKRANLRGAKLHWAKLHWAELRGVDLSGADLHGADLSGADLHAANLRGADLREADLDLSCFPLWCGGAKFKCDTKLVYQLLAHICTLDFSDDEGIKDLIMPFAVKSHRAVDLGLKEESE